VSWSFETAVVLCLIGVGVGAFGTVIGAGGGFILTPILLLLYPHDSAQTLTAISLAAVFFNAASGSVAYARQRRIDFRSGLVFAAATLPGAVGGALVVGAVSRHVFDGIMGAVLGLLAVWLIAGERWPLPAAKGHLERRELVDRAGERYLYSVPVRRGAVYSLGVGFVSSFLGIGGGVIHVPLLVPRSASRRISRPQPRISCSRSWPAPARSPTSGSAASRTATASAEHSRSRLASSSAPNSAHTSRSACAGRSSNGC
jgi:uncharacterized membrane protein YfcA